MFIPFSSQDPQHRYKESRGLFIILSAITLTLLLNILLIQAVTEPDITEVETTTPSDMVDSWPVFTLTEVATHNTATDCWMAAYGNVYDLTPYVSANSHPGGRDSLTSGCGTDATTVFDRIHSAGAKADLATFQIGVMTN